MVNTIILSLFAGSFLIERCYFYAYYNVPTEPILNFNSDMHQPLNFNQNISHPDNNTNNTNITEYIMNREDTSIL
tara:strand:+ start:1796 stop:2020 length:225 start_codon:yes stop_codon:yes gene_type:complete